MESIAINDQAAQGNSTRLSLSSQTVNLSASSHLQMWQISIAVRVGFYRKVSAPLNLVIRRSFISLGNSEAKAFSEYLQLFFMSLSSALIFMMKDCRKRNQSFLKSLSHLMRRQPMALSMETTQTSESITSSSFSLFSQYFLHLSMKITLLILIFLATASLAYSQLASFLTFCINFWRQASAYYFLCSSRAYRTSRSMKLGLWGRLALTEVYRLCSRVILLPCLTLECVQSAEQLRQDLPHSQTKSRPESSFLLLRLRRFQMEESKGSQWAYCGPFSSMDSMWLVLRQLIIIIQIFIIHCLNTVCLQPRTPELHIRHAQFDG